MQLESSVTLFDDNKVENRFAELQITADGITSEVSRKVGNDEVISRINQSAEAVKIQADKVNIEGATIFSSGRLSTNSLDDAYDSKGAATGSVNTLKNDLRSSSGTTVIHGGHITTGTLDADAVNANSGTFNTANIPNLNASKIAAGDISADRMKVNSISAVNGNTGTLKINAGKLDISGVITAINNNGTTTIDGGKITTNSIGANKIKVSEIEIGAAQIASGTINSARIPDLSADKIKSGTIASERIVSIGPSSGAHSSVTANGLDVYTGTESDATRVARFGSSIILGAPQTPHLEMTKSESGTITHLLLKAFNKNGVNFGTLQYSSDVSANTYSTYFRAYDTAHPGQSAYAAGLSFRAGSDSTVRVDGKKLLVEAIHRLTPNADRTAFSIASNPIGDVKNVDVTSVSTAISNDTAIDLTGGYVTLGSGTWIILATVTFSGAASGKVGARLVTSPTRAYDSGGTAQNHGYVLVPVATNTTRIAAFAVVEPTAATTYCWLNAYATKAQNVTNYFIRAVKIF